MDDMISRAAAIDAIANEFDECGIEYGPNEVVHRVTCELKNLPAVDAIPVEWIQAQVENEKRAPLFRRYADALLIIWQKEQEAR